MAHLCSQVVRICIMAVFEIWLMWLCHGRTPRLCVYRQSIWIVSNDGVACMVVLQDVCVYIDRVLALSLMMLRRSLSHSMCVLVSKGFRVTIDNVLVWFHLQWVRVCISLCNIAKVVVACFCVQDVRICIMAVFKLSLMTLRRVFVRRRCVLSSW